MTSYDDDGDINFKKLEKELNEAVEADARYWRENDAKFRAVNQKVASYDEFKDIVKASHIKPLEKDDRLTNIKFTQPWNSQAKKIEQRMENLAESKEPQDRKVQIPTNGQAFVREWRKLNKNTESQFLFLFDIGADRLAEIFKPEIGFGLLGEFAHCWNCEFHEQTVNEMMPILDTLSKTNRFALSVQFLSSKEKQDLKEFFGKLRNCLESTKDDKDTNDKDIDPKLFEWLQQLEKVYEIKK